MRKLLVLVTFLLAVASWALPAQARVIHLDPVDEGPLMAACNAAGGHFDEVGSHYYCIVENCDGKGGTCTITCDATGGLVTCTATVPRRHVKLGTGLANLLRHPLALAPSEDPGGGSEGGNQPSGPGGNTGGFDPTDNGSTDTGGNDPGGGGGIIIY